MLSATKSLDFKLHLFMVKFPIYKISNRQMLINDIQGLTVAANKCLTRENLFKMAAQNIPLYGRQTSKYLNSH